MPRILPITLIAVLMVLPVKIGALLEGFPVVAQQFDREFGAHERPWTTDLKGAAAAPEPPPERPAEAPAVPAAVAPPPMAAAALPAPSCTDPALRQAIDEQRADVATRARHLRDAEAVLAAAEARVGAQIRTLTGVRAEVQALMTQRSTLQQEDLRRMVAIYEAMKPRDAARIFNELETDIIVDLLDRLPERRSAPIIAEMTDAKAREVTRIILQRRALPGDRAKPPGALPAPPPMTPS